MSRNKILQIRVTTDEYNEIVEKSVGAMPNYLRSKLFGSTQNKGESTQVDECWVKIYNSICVLSDWDMFLGNLYRKAQVGPSTPEESRFARLALFLVNFANGQVSQRNVENKDSTRNGPNYRGWWVEPAPNGSVKGYWSDDAGMNVKVITNGAKSVKIREGSDEYNKFDNSGKYIID